MPSTTHEHFLAALEPVQDRLYRFALAVMGDPEDAKDLVGDTILAAYEQFSKLRDERKFFHLLLMIASRKSKRRRYRSKRFIPLDRTLAASLPSSHLREDAAAELSILLDLLQRLPKRVRETVILFEVEDLSLNAIQEIQGGTLSGVKSRLKRGRELLFSMTASERALVSIPRTNTPPLTLRTVTADVTLYRSYGK